MTTLLVAADTDFTSISMSNVDRVRFTNTSGSATATFSAEQFDFSGHAIALQGSAGINRVVISGYSHFVDPFFLLVPQDTWGSEDIVILEGSEGSERIGDFETADEIYGFGGDDLLSSSKGDDKLYGGEGDDTLNGGFGFCHLEGGAGADWMFVRGAASVDGGAGEDTLNFAATGWATGPTGLVIDLSDGGGGRDLGNGLFVAGVESASVTLTEAGDSFIGGAHLDGVDGGNGDDFIMGQDGDDQLVGGGGSDTVAGGNGNDEIFGFAVFSNNGSGNDKLSGGSGDDALHGGTGRSILRGEAGDDVVITAGTGRADGGAGRDKFGFDNVEDLQIDVAFVSGQAFTLVNGLSAAHFESFWMTGSSKADHIAGGKYSDELWGEEGDDVLFGGGGNDLLRGDGLLVSGKDVMNGGDGNDTLLCGSGDTLTGGSGRDLFDIQYLAPNPPSTSLAITDFEPDADIIKLKGIDANWVLAGNGTFTFLAGEGASFTGNAQLRWYLSGGSTFIELNTDFDPGDAELTIELSGEHALSATDFIL